MEEEINLYWGRFSLTDLTASGVGDPHENGERKRYYVASLIGLINAVTGVTGT